MAVVGILCPISCSAASVQTFRSALGRLGYEEGANLSYEYRAAEGNLNRLAGLAEDLARRHVDVIFTSWGTAAGLAAKRATTSIPIVVGSAGDLVAAGMAERLDRPGGNVTGITSLALELEGKRLELLKELLPNVSWVAVLRDVTNPYSVLAIKQQQIAASQLGLALDEIQVHESSEVDQAFATIARDQAKAVCIHAYVPVLVSRERIVALAAKYRIPAIYPLRDYVDAGGLMAYGASLNDNAERAAAQVSKILHGMRPADLPVEQSTKVELVVNLKAAKALGLTVPPALLARADEVVE